MRSNHTKTKILTSCAAALAAVLWFLPVHAQDYAGGQQQPAYEEPKPLSVPFKHDLHNKKAKITKCATCHHPLPGMRRVKGKGKEGRTGFEHRCADCHHERPAPNEPASLMVVSHKMCQGCHKANKKGPVKCSGCHKSEPAVQTQQQPTGGGNVLLPADGLFPALTTGQTPAAAAPQQQGNQTEAK